MELRHFNPKLKCTLSYMDAPSACSFLVCKLRQGLLYICLLFLNCAEPGLLSASSIPSHKLTDLRWLCRHTLQSSSHVWNLSLSSCCGLVQFRSQDTFVFHLTIQNWTKFKNWLSLVTVNVFVSHFLSIAFYFVWYFQGFFSLYFFSLLFLLIISMGVKCKDCNTASHVICPFAALLCKLFESSFDVREALVLHTFHHDFALRSTTTLPLSSLFLSLSLALPLLQDSANICHRQNKVQKKVKSDKFCAVSVWN